MNTLKINSVSRLAFALVVMLLVAACNPGPGTPAYTSTAPTPTRPPATATSEVTQPTVAAATPGGSGFAPVAIGQGPCVGVQDPEDVNVPTDGKSKQWPAPEQVIDPTHTYCAILRTDKGRIVIQLYPEIAPQHVNSFVFLAQQGFYDGVTWHRVISDFVAQTGDPSGTGSGGPGYNNIPLEISPLAKYDRIGVLGMARTNDPNSAGSQFFITYAPVPNLDPGVQGPGYTIFGQVVEGMEAVRQITPRDPSTNANLPEGDRLVSVRIVDLGTTR